MDANLKEAIRLLGAYTAGRFRVWALAGRSKASCRAHVLSALLGHKVTQSEAGVNRLRDELLAAAGIAGGCAADDEDLLADFCRAAQGGSSTMPPASGAVSLPP